MEDLNTMAPPEAYRALTRGPGAGLVRRLLELARDEDLGAGGKPGDLTSLACGLGDQRASARIVSRSVGVVAGLAVLPEAMALLAPACSLDRLIADASPISVGQTLATISGPIGQILAGERTILNLLGRLSGVATATAAFVARVRDGAGGGARVYDTRKTTPGLRILEKYAVRCGGGYCHRLGLHDAMLIKDNHIAALGPGDLARKIEQIARRARAMPDDRKPAFVEVEVDDLEQLRAVLSIGPGLVDIVLLDNMSPDELRQAARLRAKLAPGIQLEASGGITIETIGAISATGVDRISVGAITHRARWLDIGLDLA